MKDKNLRLAVVLLVCAVLVCALALVMGGFSTGAVSLEQSPYKIVISEICTKNDTIIADNDGKYRDYIELYNSGDPVNLEGFALTDGKVTCYPFGSAVLGTGEYRLVFLGDSLTGFALGASGGDCIQLQDPDGVIVAQANTAAVLDDQVMLYRNGIYTTSYEASPGYENSAAGLDAFRKGSPAREPALVISEVLLGNISSQPDENGIYSDVVELWNVSGRSVSLSGYCLSDSIEQRHRYRLPDLEIAPGAYLIIYCDSENYIGENGEIHANFALSHGETLVLTDTAGRFIRLEVQHCADDVSYALHDDGSYQPAPVSLGYANTEEGVTQFLDARINAESPLLISEVLLSSAQVPYNGAFRDVAEIQNCGSSAISTEGWYLSDGGDPYEYPLPAQTLQPGECMVIICSPQTTGFALSEGECLRLTGPDYRPAPVVSCSAAEVGMSIGKQPDTLSASYSFVPVSLGYENSEAGQERYLQTQLKDGLRISELMSANQSWLQGAYGETADWIELYNASNQSIHLSDYCLSDDSGNLDRYPLPDKILEPGEYCVLFVKPDPLNLLRGYDVLPFSLSSDGEQLYLSKGGYVADCVVLPGLSADEAYGRPGDSLICSLLAAPTPGRKNEAAAEKCSMPTADVPQGSYDNVDDLVITLSGDGEIYYTTDCTVPGRNAIKYTGPIRVTETTVLRVVCRAVGKRQSDPLDLTYLINENDTLPAVSIVTDPDNLWSAETGIYTAGPGASAEFPFFGANFWRDWERPASLSLMEKDGSGFYTHCGIKIFGGYTVAMPKKSLSCMFRDCYGDGELVYPLFGGDSLDSYETVVLRAGGQDALRAKMRDVVATSLFGEYTGVPVQDYKPVALYLNGEYWGIYFFREKINKHFLAGHYNVPAETMNVVKLAGWSCPEYIDLVKYTAAHDMTDPQHYDYVCSQIDVDSYIDFLAAEICTANTDNGNVKYFLSPEGKWTWLFYDLDLSMIEYNKNTLEFYFTPFAIGTDDYTCKTFAYKMIDNPEFREKFLTRLAWQMNNIWTEENMLSRIDEIEALIRPDMAKECARWDMEYSMWEYSMEVFRTFARERNKYLLQYVQNWFQLSDAEMRQYGFIE